jgi:hypothetical protein
MRLGTYAVACERVCKTSSKRKMNLSGAYEQKRARWPDAQRAPRGRDRGGGRA